MMYINSRIGEKNTNDKKKTKKKQKKEPKKKTRFPDMAVFHCWNHIRRDFKEELRKQGADSTEKLISTPL